MKQLIQFQLLLTMWYALCCFIGYTFPGDGDSFYFITQRADISCMVPRFLSVTVHTIQFAGPTLRAGLVFNRTVKILASHRSGF